MPLYNFLVTKEVVTEVETVIHADSVMEAHSLLDQGLCSDIVSNEVSWNEDAEYEARFMGEVKTLKDLPQGWVGDELPYQDKNLEELTIRERLFAIEDKKNVIGSPEYRKKLEEEGQLYLGGKEL